MIRGFYFARPQLARLRLFSTSQPINVNEALDLEEIDVNLFRASSKSLWTPSGSRGVFGGQVIGQALVASTKTITPDMSIHSMHSYFLLPGNAEFPILYNVRRLRDGKSFATRSVVASQRGEPIFNCQVSFHKPEESSLVHQDPMPEAPDPESLPSMTDIINSYLKDPRLQSPLKEMLQSAINTPFPIDVRYCTPINHFNPKKMPAHQLVWMRAQPNVVKPQGQLAANFNSCITAFVSDWGFSSTSLFPHGLVYPHPKIKMIASLDHAMWFYGDFSADEWMLYEFSSPRAAGARGFNFGKIFRKDGQLVVTVAQEAVIRVR